MEAFVLYSVFSIFGVAGARAIRSGLRQTPQLEIYARQIASAVIWALVLLYFWHYPSVVIQGDDTSAWRWFLLATVPWTIASLGLPLIVPRLWAATIAGLKDPAVQWVLAVVTALLSYVVFTLAQAAADHLIMGLVQTHPNQLSGAQRLLTAAFAVYGWLLVLLVLLVVATLALFIVPMIETRSSGRFVGSTAFLTLIFALFQLPLSTVQALPRPLPTLGSVQESLVLWGSFLPNELIESTEHSEEGALVKHVRLACRNLPPGAYVTFSHPDEVAPNRVIVAERKAGPVPDGAPTYAYRLASCENAINPGGLE